jgi:hypothetical protein
MLKNLLSYSGGTLHAVIICGHLGWSVQWVGVDGEEDGQSGCIFCSENESGMHHIDGSEVLNGLSAYWCQW